MSLLNPHLSYKNGTLFMEGVSLTEIAHSVGTPVYVYSSKAFLEPYLALRAGLPDSLICFAMKSNSNLSVLRLFAEAGAGIDIVSGGELFRAKKAGFSPEKIVFSGVGKTRNEIIEALEFGIYSFNVESFEELTEIQSVASCLKKTAKVALRFNPSVDPKTHPYISTGLKKNKFGMPQSEILEIIKRRKELGRVSIDGISVHIGSQLLSLSPLQDTFQKVLELLEKMKDVPISFIDLGGGLGVRYKSEKPPTLERYCKLISKYFGSRPDLKILIEPGRVLTANAGILLTQVLYRKPRSKKDFLIVDAGMNDLLRPALYESYHDVLPVSENFLAPKRLKLTEVVGPVCESSDCLASDRKISIDIKSGDLLAIQSAGAYGFSMASNYNSRPRPPEVLIDHGQFKLIRKRERYSDLIQEEILD